MSSAEDSTIQPDREHQSRCIACDEPIRAAARFCPQCRTDQAPSRWKTVGTAFKWIGGVVTLVSLIVGVVTLSGIYTDWRERRQAVTELVHAADWLTNTEAYTHAWELYQEALELEPGSLAASRGRLELATKWLLNMRIVGDETFSDIADKLVPVLYRGMAAADNEQKASILAHVGWSYFLKDREMPTVVDIHDIFRRAVTYDPDNPYANVLWGFWYLSEDENLDSAKVRFEVALSTGKHRELVREYQLSALRWPVSRLSIDNDTSRAQINRLNMLQEALGVVNEMRVNDEPKPGEGSRAAILQNYLKVRTTALLEKLISLLSPEEHLKTIEWLRQGGPNIGRDAEALTEYVRGRLFEIQGDTASAISIYRELAAESYYIRSFEFDKSVDEAIKRLTGEITERYRESLQRTYFKDEIPDDAEPWDFHKETLLNFEPRFVTDNFREALDYFMKGALDGNLRNRIFEVIEVLEESRQYITDWIKSKEEALTIGDSIFYTMAYSISDQRIVNDNLNTVWNDIGVLALQAGRYDKAIAEFTDLLVRARPSESFTDMVLFNLACAYSLRSDTYEGSSPGADSLRNADLEQALEYLKRSVANMQENNRLVDWEHIKSDPQLEPLRSHEEYQELIRGR